MAERQADEYHRQSPPDEYQHYEEEQPGLVDGIRFLYQHRLGLAARFVVFFGIGVIASLYFILRAPISVSGTVGLAFRGIERHEYPTGKKFSVEDFRAPGALAKALDDVGISKETLDIRGLASHLYVDPVIPADIQARWKKQEREGTRRDEYYPNEFNVSMQVTGLNNSQRLRLFDALIKRYQERVKFEQKSALSFIVASDVSYDKLSTIYDFWDVPALFRDRYRSLNGQINNVIEETLQSQDSKYQMAFRDIARELNIWETTRLQTLEALTYQGHLVRNRDIMIQRVQYQIEDLDIRIKQKTQEAAQAERLLDIVDRPKALLSSQVSNERGIPVVDITALEKLIKSDYVAPLVDRISKLQQEAQALEADKLRLQRQLVWLPKAANVDLEHLPPGYREMIQTLSAELKSIIQNYNRLLDEYLTATVTSLVTIKQSPIVGREGLSPALMLAGVVVMAVLLSVMMMGIEHLFQKAREQANPAGKAHTAD